MNEQDRYEVLSSETKHDGRILKVIVDKVRMPYGEVCEREVVMHKGAVGIITVLEGRKIVLVEQYRHPVRKRVLEIPAGKLAEGEDPKDCAQRELKEETGYLANKLVKLVSFFTSPGYSNERFHLYLADDVVAGEKNLEGGEEHELKVVEISIDEAIEEIKNSGIEDGKTIAAIYLAKEHLDKHN